MKRRRRILALILPWLLVPGAFAQWTSITASHIVDAAGNPLGTSAPTVSISGGSGSGAAATVAVSNGAISTCTITGGGTGYTSTPTATVSGGSGSGATLSLTVTSGAVTGCAVSGGGAGYTTYQPGQICVLPVDATNHPLGVRPGGTGGTVVSIPGCAWVVNGAITGAVGNGWIGNGTFVVPDTSLASPQNPCLRVTIKTFGGSPVTPPGYNCLQMQSSWCTAGSSGYSSCNLDSWTPPPSGPLSLVSAPQFDPSVTISTLSPGSSATAAITPEGGALFHVAFGIPQGATGAQGPTGPAGSMSAASSFEATAYADQLQSPSNTGNNGIAVSLTDCLSYPYACRVVAPALYAQTEAQPWGGAFQWGGNDAVGNIVHGPAAGQPTGCVEDDRFGPPQWICNGAEPPPSWAGGQPVVGPSFIEYNTGAINGSFSPVPPALTVQLNNLFGTTYGTFQAQTPAFRIFDTNDAPSVAHGFQIDLYANAPGDTVPYGLQAFERGGLSSGDSEGIENRTIMQEAQDVYRGTVNSITSQTGTSTTCYGPCTIFNTTQTQGYPGSMGDELPFIDLSQGDSTGYISSLGQSPFQIICAGCDWDTKYGTSVHTTTTASTPSQPSTNPLLPLTNAVVTVSSTTGFSAGQNACILSASGTNWEYEPVTSINSSTSMTFGVLRKVYGSGAIVSQGGMVCMGIELTADEVGPTNAVAQVIVSNASGMTAGTYPLSFSGGTCSTAPAGNMIVASSTQASANITNEGVCSVAPTSVTSTASGTYTLTLQMGSMNGQYSPLAPVNVIRTLWPIAYNVSGGTLYTANSTSGYSFNVAHTLAFQEMGSGGTVSCTVAGGVISSCTASGGTGYLNYNSTSAAQASPVLTISGLTGCTSTPSIYIASTSGNALATVGIANNGTSGCTGTPTVTITPVNGYVVYPQAKAINVWNPSTGNVDGSSIATLPPAGTFNSGDVIEQEHHYVEKYTLHHEFSAGFQGADSMNGNVIGWGGRNNNADYNTIQNFNADNLYNGYPGGTPWANGLGSMIAPTYTMLTGPWSAALQLQQPTFGVTSQTKVGAVAIGCGPSGNNVCTSWNAWSILLNHANAQNSGNGQDVLEYNPSTGNTNSLCWEWTVGSTSAGGGTPTHTFTYCASGGLELDGAVLLQAGNSKQNVDNYGHQVVAVASSETASAADNNHTLKLASGITYTLPNPQPSIACISGVSGSCWTVTLTASGGNATVALASGMTYLTSVTSFTILQGQSITIKADTTTSTNYTNGTGTLVGCGSGLSCTFSNGQTVMAVTSAPQLTSTPTQCSGSQFSTGIAANGNANCATPPSAALGGVMTGYCVGTFASSSTTLSLAGLGSGNSPAVCTGTLTANVGFVVPPGGPYTLSNLSVRCNHTGVNSSSGVFTVMVAASGTSSYSTTPITVTYGTTTGGTTVTDSTDTYSVSSGSVVGVEITTQGSEVLGNCSASIEW